MKDLKEGLSSTRKPDITHVRIPFMVYTSRPCEYGGVKYQRANFLRDAATPKLERQRSEPIAADWLRFRDYLRAAFSHIGLTLDAMEAHEANDPNLVDVAGMVRSAYAIDTDAPPGSKFPPSYLPHVAPACSSLNMAITQAVRFGLLPADPGQPWNEAERVDGDPIVLRETVAKALERSAPNPDPLLSSIQAAMRLPCISEPVFDFSDVEPKTPRAGDASPDPMKAGDPIPPSQF